MKFRKIISLVLVLCMVTMMPVFATKEPAFDYDVAYRWAIDAGFPKEFIDTIDETFLEKIYYDNKDTENLEIEATVVQLYETGNGVQRGNISSSAMDFWIVGGKVSSAAGYIMNVNLYVHYEWNTWPTVGPDQDAITVTWDPEMWVFDSDSFEATFSDSLTDPYDEISRPAKATNGGIGWYCPMPSIPGTVPFGRAAFKLEPVDADLPTGNDNRTQFSAEYAHSRLDVSDINLSFGDLGVTISGSYDSAADTLTLTYGDYAQ